MRFVGIWMLTVLLVIVVAPSASEARDGRIEINQTCAIATGCAPGDAPGFPVSLNAAGSYQLTSNLKTTDANTTLITVGADDLHIDLAGFTIEGPFQAGSGDGITRGFGFFQRTHVENGMIVGVGRDGIRLGDHAHIEDVSIVGVGRDGLVAGASGLVRGNSISDCADDAIQVGAGSRVEANVLGEIGDNWIVAQGATSVIENVAYTDSGIGFAIVRTGGGTEAVTYGQNVFEGSGGVAVFGTPAIEIAPNICAFDTTCP